MPGASLPAKRVLVVDDNQDIRAFLIDLLRDSGYEATAATTGDEALRCLSGVAFDLLIIDLVMPDCCGQDLITEIQAIYPSVNIVVVSGYAGCLEQRRLKEMGVKRILTKPFKPERLLEVAHILTGRAEALNKLLGNSPTYGMLSSGAVL